MSATRTNDDKIKELLAKNKDGGLTHQDQMKLLFLLAESYLDLKDNFKSEVVSALALTGEQE